MKAGDVKRFSFVDKVPADTSQSCKVHCTLSLEYVVIEHI